MYLMRQNYHYNKGTMFLFTKAIQMIMVLLFVKMSESSWSGSDLMHNKLSTSFYESCTRLECIYLSNSTV